MKSLPLSAAPANDESVLVVEQLIVLKRKRMQLSGGTDAIIDRLKLAIQAKMTEEDEEASGHYGFPDDKPDLLYTQLPAIEAQMVEKFTPAKHCKFQDLTYVYHSQPWLAEEAVKDVRIEDEQLVAVMEAAKLAGDLRALRANIKSGRDGVKEVQDKINKLELEMKKKEWTEPAPGPDGEVTLPKDEPPEMKQQRMAVLQALQNEHKAKVMEHSINAAIQVRTEAFEKPLLEKMQVEVEKQARLTREMTAGRIRRERMSVKFLSLEGAFNEHAIASVQAAQAMVATMKAKKELQRSICLSVVDSRETLLKLYDEIESETYDRKNTERYEALDLRLPLSYERMGYTIQSCLHKNNPREECAPLDRLEDSIKLRLRCLEMDLFRLEKLESGLNDEIAELSTYQEKRAEYEELSAGLGQIVMNKRKQKSTQFELNERLRRLYLARYGKIKIKLDDRAKVLSEEARLEAERKHLEGLKKGKKTPLTKVADYLRKASRRTKDMIINRR